MVVAAVAAVAGAVAAAVGGDRRESSRCNLFCLSAQVDLPRVTTAVATHEHVVPSTSSGGGVYYGTALDLARADHQQGQTSRLVG